MKSYIIIIIIIILHFDLQYGREKNQMGLGQHEGILKVSTRITVSSSEHIYNNQTFLDDEIIILE